MPLSSMKRNKNIYKAFTVKLYVRSKGSSSKSVAAKKEAIQETVIEEVVSAKMQRMETSKQS